MIVCTTTTRRACEAQGARQRANRIDFPDSEHATSCRAARDERLAHGLGARGDVIDQRSDTKSRGQHVYPSPSTFIGGSSPSVATGQPCAGRFHFVTTSVRGLGRSPGSGRGLRSRVRGRVRWLLSFTKAPFANTPTCHPLSRTSMPCTASNSTTRPTAHTTTSEPHTASEAVWRTSASTNGSTRRRRATAIGLPTRRACAGFALHSQCFGGAARGRVAVAGRFNRLSRLSEAPGRGRNRRARTRVVSGIASAFQRNPGIGGTRCPA